MAAAIDTGRTRPMSTLGGVLAGPSAAFLHSSQIATLVERHSRYVMLIRVDSKETQVVTKALAKTIRQLPTQLRRSLTWDRGSEMKAHRDFTVATDVQVWQQ